MTNVGNIAYGVAVSYKFCGKELDRMNGMDWYNGDGQEVFAATYDPWGKQTVTRNDIGFYRGYCGHEMITEFSLINMNGRIYDPVLGRFISPDNYVQEPENPQNYNRYSYCMNNPVKYTDPSGELFGIDDFVIASIAAKFVFSTAMSYSSGQSLWKSVSSAAIQAGVDIAVAAGTAGIGNAMGHGVGTFGNELARAGLHGMLQGTGSALMGGDYLQGFTAGAFSSLAGSGAQVLGLGSSGILGSTTLAGGFCSYIAGGDFINGASTGFSIGLLNHLGKRPQDDKDIAYTINLDGVDILGKKPIQVINKLEYNASMIMGHKSQGLLNMYNNIELVACIKAVSGSGTPALYTLPPGNYSVNYFERAPNTGKFSKDGIGFKAYIKDEPYDPMLNRKHSLLRIHPARYNGTEGCIGLRGTREELIKTRDLLENSIRINGSIPLKVSIIGY